MRIYSLPKDKIRIIPNGIVVGKIRTGSGRRPDQGEVWNPSASPGGALLRQDEHSEGTGSPGRGDSPYIEE